MTGIYLHVPFCIVRCNYCDFNAYAGLDHLADRYVEALLREIDARADGRVIETIFFGGGTPTQLSVSQLGSVLDRIRDRFCLESETEVTLEANPESIDSVKLKALNRAGFDRISIGVQSLAPHVLVSLGRVHDAISAERSLREAIAAGFPHVNADLIFGTPGESMADWRSTLQAAVETGVDHISAYALTIEEGTPLQAMIEKGAARSPDEDDQADKYEFCHEYLSGKGFHRYEISNWAKPGGESRHNLGYWRGLDYFGFGAGAHSHFDGRRSWNVRSVHGYVDRSPDVEEGSEIVSDRLSEAAVLALRMSEGIDVAAFTSRWGVSPLERWRAELGPLARAGFVNLDASRIAIPGEKMFVAGEVFRAVTG